MTVVATATPLVSVIVPVWNVEPYLRQCLDSVVAQTIGFDRIELIAVDDGSTDGSGAILDEYAARHRNVIVIHEPNSGGPGRPRNVGLNHASAPYVFFLDGDDYLGPEGLERLVAMAERNGSDIVLGRIVGVGGRAFHSADGMFTRNRDRADVARVARSGNVQKLIRRSIIERGRRRFDERLRGGEDGDFMARLYLDVGVVSVVGDYDVYFLRRRAGSQTLRTIDAEELLESIRRIDAEGIGSVVARHGPGRQRDAFLYRHIKQIAWQFRGGWRALDDDHRRRVFEAGSQVIRHWHTPGVQVMLPAWARYRTWCLHHGRIAELEDVAAQPGHEAFADPILEGGRVYARYPHFRDDSAIPDDCFDITDEIHIEQVLDSATVQLTTAELVGRGFLVHLGGRPAILLQRWPRGRRWAVAIDIVETPDLHDHWARYPAAGFRARIDARTAAGGKPLESGSWRVVMSVATEAITRTEALRVPLPVASAWRRENRPATGNAALHLAATPTRELRLRVGQTSGVTPFLEAAEAAIDRAATIPRRIAKAQRQGILLPRLVATLGRCTRRRQRHGVPGQRHPAR